MSKMSRIAMELDEQAVEWGFRDREDAEAHGLAVAYGKEGAYLYKPQSGDEQLKAHKTWLEEKKKLLARADEVWESPNYDDLLNLVSDLVKFIERGEY